MSEYAFAHADKGTYSICSYVYSDSKGYFLSFNIRSLSAFKLYLKGDFNKNYKFPAPSKVTFNVTQDYSNLDNILEALVTDVTPCSKETAIFSVGHNFKKIIKDSSSLE